MRWWIRLVRRKQMEDQLEKELRFHLDQHASDLVDRGCAPDDAHRQARLSLGGPEQVKEKCRDARGTRWLEDLVRDTKYTGRTLRQKPGFAAVTIIILALGIGAGSVMFALVNSVLLKPLAFPQADRLVAIHGFEEQFGEFWGFSDPDFADVKRQTRSLSVAAWTYGGGTISSPGEPEYVDGRKISADLLATLGTSPLHGRGFHPEEDRPGAEPVAIISYSLWQRRFAGDPSAVGRPLVYDGQSYTIAGVLPSGFQLSGQADVYTPLDQSTDPRLRNRGARFLHVVARLRPGVAIAGAQSEIAIVSKRLAHEYPETDRGVALLIRPLQQELVGDVRGTLWLLLSAAGLVLLIACVNIASLFLTRAVSRERELAMRFALGAARGRLIRQCLTESALLSICGGLGGVLLGSLALRPFIVLWPGSLPRSEEVHLDWSVLLFAIGVSLAGSLFFGVAPALQVPFHKIEQVLRAGGRVVAGASRRLHATFVIAEIALAFVLLVCAGLLGRTFVALSSLDPGLNIHNVLTAHFALSPATPSDPPQIRRAWQDVLDRARSVPGVETAALTDIVPMRVGENSLGYRASAAALPSGEEPVALASCVTPGYLKVMGIPLRAGRFLDEHDREGSERVIVIDENLARHAFGGQSAVGRQLWISAMGDAPLQIVGVVGHVRHWGLAGDDLSRVRDQMYYPFAQVPAPLLRVFSSVMSIAVRTKAPPLNMIDRLRSELRGAAGDQVLYEPRTMEQLVSSSLDRQRFLMFLFGAFAAVALILASIGIYGVIAYLTGQRIPEIGVRMALGATTRDVIRMVLRQSLNMALVGLSVGLLGSLAADWGLRRAVQGMQPLHAGTFAITIPVLLSAALLAGFIPALRAGRVDPVRALRED